MTGNLLLRGMIAGIIAGLLAFGFARAFGEPQVDLAIAFEEKMAALENPNAPAEPEVVSRNTQAGIGLFTGVMTYSIAMGGIFSLVFAGLYGRASRLSPRALRPSRLSCEDNIRGRPGLDVVGSPVEQRAEVAGRPRKSTGKQSKCEERSRTRRLAHTRSGDVPSRFGPRPGDGAPTIGLGADGAPIAGGSTPKG